MWSNQNSSRIAGGENGTTALNKNSYKVEDAFTMSLRDSTCMYLPKRDGNTSTEGFVHKYSSVLLTLVKNSPNACNHKWLNK